MIKSEDIVKFTNFCKENFDFTDDISEQKEYKSLAVCVLDCVFSLRAIYNPTCINVINRFSEKFLNGNKYSENYSLKNFIEDYDSVGEIKFRSEILRNNQMLSGRHKTEVCYDLSKNLLKININTLEDFRKAETEAVEREIRSVRGLKDAAVNYMFMLAGDPSRCKPDTHIHHCIRDALGYDISNDDCQTLFTETTKLLKKDYQSLTVRKLDYIVWQSYSSDN